MPMAYPLLTPAYPPTLQPRWAPDPPRSAKHVAEQWWRFQAEREERIRARTRTQAHASSSASSSSHQHGPHASSGPTDEGQGYSWARGYGPNSSRSREGGEGEAWGPNPWDRRRRQQGRPLGGFERFYYNADPGRGAGADAGTHGGGSRGGTVLDGALRRDLTALGLEALLSAGAGVGSTSSQLTPERVSHS